MACLSVFIDRHSPYRLAVLSDLLWHRLIAPTGVDGLKRFQHPRVQFPPVLFYVDVTYKLIYREDKTMWVIILEFIVLAACLIYWVISSTMADNRIDELENEKRTWQNIRQIERYWDSVRSSEEKEED